MKRWFVYEYNDCLCGSGIDAAEDIDCASAGIVAGTLQTIEADSKAKALLLYRAKPMDIIYKIFDDVDFLGYENARKEWINL